MNMSWRTTILGALLAVAVALEPIITTGSINWKQVGVAAFIAAISYFAKDANVTGGTKTKP